MSKRNNHNHRTERVGTMVDNLSSGYVIQVLPLPPYYIDLVEDTHPLRDYPQRKIVLASGDIINWAYEPPDIIPDEGTEDYDLYMMWMSADNDNKVIQAKRKRAKRDFLLSNCIIIQSGPEDVEDDAWVIRVEASFNNWKVPTHPGKRLLAFIKTQVILTADEMELILSLCVSPEATMQGILNALHGFRAEVE